MTTANEFDLAIIGGGINGCGIAADAALRGLSVVLIEKGDLASQTSSNSSKLIHGGLRYLEHYEFSLVKKALDERQTLLHIAPHLVKPLAFVLPKAQNMRPSWLLRAGLFIYDHLSFRNRLPKSKGLSRKKNASLFTPVNPSIDKGFLYYDAQTNDTRLTINVGQLATQHGAAIQTYCELIEGRMEQGKWRLHTQALNETQPQTIRARAVVNASGPWVKDVNQRLGIQNDYPLSLVKGSHIVVKPLYEGQHAYVFQHQDHRIIFCIPYQGKTVIGTTDVPYQGALDTINISEEEIHYLLNSANTYLNKHLEPKDIIETFSGVRPLLGGEGKPQELSRDYLCIYQSHPAPCVTVYGGKITTYRQLAKDAVDALWPCFPTLPASTTHKTRLPGGNYHGLTQADFEAAIQTKYAWLPRVLGERLLESYGSLVHHVLHGCDSLAGLGLSFGHDVFQREVDYLIAHEWARSAEDILERRLKRANLFSKEERDALQKYVAKRLR